MQSYLNPQFGPPRPRLRIGQPGGPLVEDPNIGRTFLSKDASYTLIRKLGSGGMASVYVAVQKAGNHEAEVAFKILSNNIVDTDPMLRTRFQGESRAMALVQHPNVAALVDFGEFEGQLFLASEYVRGVSLRQMISRYGDRLPLEYCREALLQICSGLGAVHKAGIIHRDMKPENIICLDEEPVLRHGRPMLKIIDFGISRILANTTRITVTGEMVGTPEYMAPEQDQKFANGRIDIYSVSIIGYELLTGKVPFSAPEYISIVLKHKTVVPVPPTVQAPKRDIPPGAENIILRGLAKRPEDRYQTATEMAEDIRQKWHRKVQRQAVKWLKSAAIAGIFIAGTAAGIIFRDNIVGLWNGHVAPLYQKDKTAPQATEEQKAAATARHRPAPRSRAELPETTESQETEDGESDTVYGAGKGAGW